MDSMRVVLKRPWATERTPSEDASLKSTEQEKEAGEVSVSPTSSDEDQIEDEGLGRHLGVFSCTLLIVGRVIGTGIFSTPSTILADAGSIGASLLLWVVGYLFSLAGLLVWMEFGTMIPRSGGEKNYLEAVYRPKSLATVFFGIQAICLSTTAAGCITFAQNILVAAGQEPGRWSTRGIALGVIFFATVVHGLTPRVGVHIMNVGSVAKIFILLFVIVTGWVVLAGRTRIKDPGANFRDAFAGSSHSSGDYSEAMFKVLFGYGGWNNVNYVMNEVKDPVRTLKISGILGLGICVVLYILANIAFFAASTKQEIVESGTTVASVFFKNVFGEQAQKALTVVIALSALGLFSQWKRDIDPRLLQTFAQGRVNQELAKEGIPLPFGSRFWATRWPTGKAPLPGLLLHLIPTTIVILAPPPAVAYPFVLDLEGYPAQIINLLVVIGLLYLRWKKPDAPRPYRVPWPIAAFFLMSAVFLLVVPFIRPSNGVGDTPPLPYYLYCLVAIGVMVFAVAVWVTWRIVLPRLFHYRLARTRKTLRDGTVITVFEKQKEG